MALEEILILLLGLGVILLEVALLVHFYMRGKALLMFLQQEEYDARRFIRWWWHSRAFDRYASLAFLIFSLAGAGLGLDYTGTAWLMLYAVPIALVPGLIRSRRILAGAKKPLVMTARAKRIHTTFLILTLVMLGLAAPIGIDLTSLTGKLVFLALLQMPPFLLVLANLILRPLEGRVRAGFLDQAREKLGQNSPTIIGIAGSYGKTSTKHILAHILSSAAPTLATPGSVNTEMGITRIIREDLEGGHKYFIVEMGAYGKGSIAGLTALTPPDLGIITSVGLAHFERFGSAENIFEAKFELADAVRKGGGKTIVFADDMPQEMLERRLAEDDSLAVLSREGGGQGAQGARIRNLNLDRAGISFDLEVEASGAALHLEAPIYGLHQAGNMALAALAALQLGLPEAVIRASLRTLPQTRHRLEVIPSKKGPTVIDDAYNSNPVGFASALEVLKLFAEPPGRRFLITPGMVELGEEHAAQHLELGRLAGASVDRALVVTPGRIPTFIQGFEETRGKTASLSTFSTQAEAEEALKKEAGAGDAVLFENNLPDLFETKVVF